jgi:hypothetical protein
VMLMLSITSDCAPCYTDGPSEEVSKQQIAGLFELERQQAVLLRIEWHVHVQPESTTESCDLS